MNSRSEPAAAGSLVASAPSLTGCFLRCDSGKECEDVYRRGGRDSQMYLIQPDQSTPPFKVFCDQTGNSGGEQLTPASNVQLLRTYPAFRVNKTTLGCLQKGVVCFPGWLLIQNRLDGSVDFGRRWDDYRSGFGNIAFQTQKGYCETPG